MDEILGNGKRHFLHSITKDDSKEMFVSHNHNGYELYLFVSGNAEFIIEGKSYRLMPHSLLLVKPMEFHYVDILGSGIYERYVIQFVKSCVPSDILEALDSKPPFFAIPTSSNIIKIMHRLKDVSNILSKTDYDYVLQNSIIDLLIELKYLSAPTTQSNTNNPIAQKIADYIATNIEKPLSLKSLSSELFLSASYISHLFKDCYKISIMNYIKKKKIIHANELIQSGTSPTKVAQACGFDDYSTFYRQYKKTLNKIPSNKEHILF